METVLLLTLSNGNGNHMVLLAVTLEPLCDTIFKLQLR